MFVGPVCQNMNYIFCLEILIFLLYPALTCFAGLLTTWFISRDGERRDGDRKDGGERETREQEGRQQEREKRELERQRRDEGLPPLKANHLSSEY